MASWSVKSGARRWGFSGLRPAFRKWTRDDCSCRVLAGSLARLGHRVVALNTFDVVFRLRRGGDPAIAMRTGRNGDDDIIPMQAAEIIRALVCPVENVIDVELQMHA